MNKDLIYFDNNGTTRACKDSIVETTKWMSSCSNPSTNNKLSLPSKKLIESAKKYILSHCNTNHNNYCISFTSCASESNIYIIQSIVLAYKFLNKVKPHIICSSIEHSSIIECVNNLEYINEVDITYVNPSVLGIINAIDIKNAIKKNTCLILVMGSNNEIGSINPVKEIAAISKKYNIAFHTDYVQLFGKYKIDLSDNLIGSLSASFHKFYGPLGIGLLIINNKIIQKYNLCREHSDPLRGVKIGTPAVPLIAGGVSAMKYNFLHREKKNKALLSMRNAFLSEINKYIPIVYYDELPKTHKDPIIVIFGPHKEYKKLYAPNTILLSIYSKKLIFCNILLKKYLEKNNIIVSIGSACNTHKTHASHVIESLKPNSKIKKGVLRISFGDYNTNNQVTRFIKVFLNGINKQLTNL